MATTMSHRSPRESYEIISPRLVIRTAFESDAEELHQFLTTAQNFPHTPFDKELQVETLRGSIGRWKDTQAKGDNAFMIIVLRETGQVIGQGSYNCFEWVEAPATSAGEAAAAGEKKMLTDFGLILDHKYWRKGLGTEAICSLVDFAIEELGCSLFRTETASDNAPWRAIIRSIGLDEFESFGPQSIDAKVEGWNYNFDADDWQKVKINRQKSGKWPL